MRPSRLALLVLGCLLVIPAIALLVGGSALGLGYAFGRGDDGYVDADLDRLATDTVAITAEDIDFTAEPGSPDRIFDALDADVRLRVTSAANATDVFVGIAPEVDVDRYLSGVAHAEIAELDDDLGAVYRDRAGGDEIAAPTEQDFWVASATGTGTQELTWDATSGRWAVVVMNADGAPGVAADVNVGAKAGFVFPLTMIMLAIGTVLALMAVALIALGASSLPPGGSTSPRPDGPTAAHTAPTPGHPVAVTAALDPALSRWLWLVKWILAIPHLIVLAFLGIAFVVLTWVAAVAILATGRYPRRIFDFNVGVLRWGWRVNHYASTGGIATDRYPRFGLHADDDDLAQLDVAYPEQLSRPMVLVKWLLAIPHLIIVALLAGSSVRWLAFEGDRVDFDPTGGGGLLGLLALVAGLILLFTGRYPSALFDLIVGLNRWVFRVVAYVALMTDDYPPFRLDQGGSEPTPDPVDPGPPAPSGIDLRHEDETAVPVRG